MKLRDMLAKLPDSFKVAGVENPDQTQMEADFAQMAFLFLQDRAAPLVPYMIGFEVVEKEVDGSRAVGIFGFKAGNEYYYVPAFFLNGRIEGMDEIFSRKSNSFMPLQEAQIYSIIDKGLLELGGGTRGRDAMTDLERPDLSFASRPPNSGKFAAVDVLAEMRLKVATSMAEDPAFQHAFAGACAAMRNETVDDWHKQADSDLLHYLRQTGGPRAVQAVLHKLASDSAFAQAALLFYPSPSVFAISEFDGGLAPKRAESKLDVVALDESGECPVECTDEQREKLVRDSFLLIDKRSEKDTAEVYENDDVCANPTDSGVYEVVLSGGDSAEALVMLPGAGCDYAVVSKTKSGPWFKSDSSRVFVCGPAKKTGAEVYADASALDDLANGSDYALVRKDGRVAVVFSVRGTAREAGKLRKAYVSDYVYSASGPHENRYASGEFDGVFDSVSDNPAGYMQLLVSDSGGDRVVKRDDAIVVGNECKVVKLEGASDTDFAYTPGGVADFKYAAAAAGYVDTTLAASDAGSTFHVFRGRNVSAGMSAKQAAVYLARDLGIAAREVDTIMADAAAHGKARRLVKAAQHAGVSVQMPVPPGAEGYNDFSGVPVEQPFQQDAQGEMVGLNAVDTGMNPWDNIGGQTAREIGGGMPTSVTQDAEAAARSGQKQVFDHSVIGSLAKLYDVNAVLDQYMPEIEKSVDRLGRILFLFYWQHDEFAERYGMDELSDMQDSLRTAFNRLGEVVEKLKMRPPTPLDGSEMK